jgi:hypothetical protein
MLVCESGYSLHANGSATCASGWQELTHLFTVADAEQLVSLALLPLALAFSFRVIRQLLWNK